MNAQTPPSLVIYNLFPRLVGTVDKWYPHVLRAHEMGFNAIYFNPVNQTGFSGSLYSIKNFFEFNRYFHPQGLSDWTPFKVLINKIHQLTPCKPDLNLMGPLAKEIKEEYCTPMNLLVIIDLVINHSAIDSDLIKEHPNWFKQDDNGKIRNPFAIDPANANNITVWGDLAEMDNENGENTGLWDYWVQLIDFYLDLGVDGFRCDAAYQIPNKLWNLLINHAKSKKPDVLFLAETLGCREEQMKTIVKAGFDYIFNSSKWWDYTRPWAVIQENIFGKISPSVSFPESHDTDRLAAESGGRKDVSIMKYYFSALFSKSLMIPIGYEFGFRRKIDVVNTLPEHWESPLFDIREEITRINQLNLFLPIMHQETWLYHIPYPDLNILLMLKESKNTSERMLILMNKNWHERKEVWINNLNEFIEPQTKRFEISEIVKIKEFSSNQNEIRRILLPNEIYIIYSL
jgi:starch synthase (maltosyl-transferring)